MLKYNHNKFNTVYSFHFTFCSHLFILLYFFSQSLSISMNGLLSSSSVSYVPRKEVFTMDKDIFNLLFNHLEERRYNNVCQNAKQDTDYLKATQLE